MAPMSRRGWGDINSRKGERNVLREIFWYLVIAFVLIIPFRYFVAQPFIVSGNSMAPTFSPNEYIVIDKLSYHFQKPVRGEVVIFEYPLDASLYFIKRVAGIPGDTIDVANGSVSIKKVYQLGAAASSTKVRASKNNPEAPYEVTLASDEYFMVGDNGDASSDSRTWGPLQSKFIVGRASVRLFPLNKIGFVSSLKIATSSATSTAE